MCLPGITTCACSGGPCCCAAKAAATCPRLHTGSLEGSGSGVYGLSCACAGMKCVVIARLLCSLAALPCHSTAAQAAHIALYDQGMQSCSFVGRKSILALCYLAKVFWRGGLPLDSIVSVWWKHFGLPRSMLIGHGVAVITILSGPLQVQQSQVAMCASSCLH
jgi:hypothetical protein